MNSKIFQIDPTGVIDRLYEGAEDVVDDSNIIAVDFKSPEIVSCLLDDIAALLEEPSNARIAEPVLREALKHIAEEILTQS